MFIWKKVKYSNYKFDYKTNQLIRIIVKPEPPPLVITKKNDTGFKYYQVIEKGKIKNIVVYEEKVEEPIKLSKPSTQTEYPLPIKTNFKGFKYYQIFKNGIVRNILIHRLIYFMYHPLITFDLCVKHIDNDITNNKLSNLEIITNHQQAIIRKRKHTNKYIGVYFDKTAKKFKASITIDDKIKHIGYFHSQRDGAIAYNNYVINNRLNKILNDIPPKIKPVITKRVKL